MAKRTVENVSVSKIFPNPDQPRKVFTLDSLQELAGSIASKGVIQPITVVPREDGEGRTHMIVAGERRWRASVLAGKKTIPAVVRKLTGPQIDDLALLENLQREDLN